MNFDNSEDKITDSQSVLNKLSEIEVIDLIEEPQMGGYLAQAIQRIKKDYKSDTLYENYLELEHQWQEHICFHICLYQNQVVAFSGLIEKNWPQTTDIKVVRALNRTFLFEEARVKTLKGHQFPSLASRLMLPKQVQVAGLRGYQGVFISMQGKHRRPILSTLAEKLNQTEAYTYDWQLLDSFYNTCQLIKQEKINNQDSCWQNILWLPFHRGLPFPLLNRSKYFIGDEL